MTYNERKQARIDRYKEYAENAKKRSEKHLDTAHKIGDMIPMGQQILVGHPSETHERRDIDRIHNNMRKGIDEGEKADYWEHRADSAENSTAISSQDPEAVTLLREKIAELEAVQEGYTKGNQLLRRLKILKTDPEVVEKLTEAGFMERQIKHLLSCNTYGYPGKDFIIFPDYELTNNNGNIRRLKERIEYLTRIKQALETFERVETEKGSIEKNNEHNGIEVHFPGKPEQGIIDTLKANGFRWSGLSKCWYHSYNRYAFDIAKQLIGG